VWLILGRTAFAAAEERQTKLVTAEVDCDRHAPVRTATGE
jgi:hypothetical protein